jgi:hypothetical protein
MRGRLEREEAPVIVDWFIHPILQQLAQLGKPKMIFPFD